MRYTRAEETHESLRGFRGNVHAPHLHGRLRGFAGEQRRPWTAPAPTMVNPDTLSSQKLAEGTILKPPNTKGSQFRLAHWWC
jgi:hypothetical protein